MRRLPGAFDVLLVGYVSRWQRNLRQTLNLLEDVLHPAGVAVWYLFESVDVLGLDTMHVEPTPAAVRRGLAEAFRADELVMVGARGFEPPT